MIRWQKDPFILQILKGNGWQNIWKRGNVGLMKGEEK